MDWLMSHLLPESPNDVIIYLATSFGLKMAVCWLRGASPPPAARCVGHVTALKLYPVKSTGGIPLEQAECTQVGLKAPGMQLFDRSWMLLTVADGGTKRFATARQKPPLLLVTPTVRGNQLCLDAPGMQQLRIPIEPDISAVDCQQTKVQGDIVSCWDCGDEAATWFSQYLKEEHRLVYGHGGRDIVRKSHLYVNKAKPDDQLKFHDDGPFLLVPQSSFDELSRRLAERDVTEHVTMEHFRPTITISGNSPPHDEDSWNEVYINGVKFTLLMPCGRCMLTTIDPVKGAIRPDGEPLKTLRTYRMIQPKDDSPCFGTYLYCDRPGTIHVGDSVCVLERNRAN